MANPDQPSQKDSPDSPPPQEGQDNPPLALTNGHSVANGQCRASNGHGDSDSDGPEGLNGHDLGSCDEEENDDPFQDELGGCDTDSDKRSR